MKTSDLIGAHLDYWTGRADGKSAEKLSIRRVPRTDALICVYNRTVRYDPSTNWEKGGPLLENLVKAGFGVTPASWDKDLILTSNNNSECIPFDGNWDRPSVCQAANAALISICRAKVASIYGDEVQDVEAME